ncbi:MAG: threonine synthase [Bacteroidales bacterium]|nr:threonine synthase [Bacteroidales bacterium]
MITAPPLYYSTNRLAPESTFSEALLRGLAPDGGLYMPLTIPGLKESEISEFSGMGYAEIAARVLGAFLEGDIPADDLLQMTTDAYNFDVPLEKCSKTLHIMRLDRGPTASFKDFAARMMARMMQYYTRNKGRRLVVLVATSGDTGSAIASAFHGLPGIEVVILFPKGEVTDNQRRQMTTLGKNVSVMSVNGKFDDCQRMVKQAFSDIDLSQKGLTSANSINIGRLLPQSVYYFYAYSRLELHGGSPVSFAVPSGNFGNMMGGMIAKRMGLPVHRFIIATNMNDEFPEYLGSGVYHPVEPSRNCISNAMNVGHPSNLARLIALYGGRMDEKGNIISQPDLNAMRRDIFSFPVTDESSMETVNRYFADKGITVEPHGATALAAIDEYGRVYKGAEDQRVPIVALETAHPAKFPEPVAMATGKSPTVPDSLKGLDGKEEHYELIDNNYEVLKEYLLSLPDFQ